MRLFKKKRASTPQPTPYQEAMAQEEQAQRQFRQREEADREAAGEPVVPDDLEGFLKKSRETREARLLAVEKRKTAEAKTKALEAEALAQRNMSIARAEQSATEAKAQTLEEASKVSLTEGVTILEAFLDPRVGLSPAEIDTNLTPREKEDMQKAATHHDPRLIKSFLKKFRNYDRVRLEQILPEERDRELCKGITATPSPFPFWNI